jgi:hypothetical protein
MENEDVEMNLIFKDGQKTDHRFYEEDEKFRKDIP